jgi:hypothetical protein
MYGWHSQQSGVRAGGSTSMTKPENLRLLAADEEGADWREVGRIVLHIDPENQPVRARQAFETHLAQWMTRGRVQALASTRLASRNLSAALRGKTRNEKGRPQNAGRPFRDQNNIPMQI